MGFRSHRSLSLSPADTEKLVSQKRLSEEMASSDKLCREREDKTKAKTTILHFSGGDLLKSQPILYRKLFNGNNKGILTATKHGKALVNMPKKRGRSGIHSTSTSLTPIPHRLQESVQLPPGDQRDFIDSVAIGHCHGLFLWRPFSIHTVSRSAE